MVPINIKENRFYFLTNTFGCRKGSIPFTYLGLPLSLTKPTMVFLPLVNRCEKRLSSISSFLSQAGRLQLTNAVFSALPTFATCTYLLPKTVIKQIDKFHKHCLWRGPDINNRAPPKAAWKMVCTSKENGGLGVINLSTQNESLLLKHLHKFYNRMDIPWVHLIWGKYYAIGRLPSQARYGSFWWRDVLKLVSSFKGMAKVSVGDGSSCFLWTDLWKDEILETTMRQLFSYAKNKNISLQQACQASAFQDLFYLPMSGEAF
jgi:hypothetical protein